MKARNYEGIMAPNARFPQKRCLICGNDEDEVAKMHSFPKNAER